MATLAETIAKIDAIKTNPYSNEDKTAWINKLEAVIQAEITKTYPGDGTAVLTQYTWADDQNKSLIIGAPYDDIYTLYLASMIDFYNKEFMTYNNSKNMFNQAYLECSKYYTRTNLPAQSNSISGLWG